MDPKFLALFERFVESQEKITWYHEKMADSLSSIVYEKERWTDFIQEHGYLYDLVSSQETIASSQKKIAETLEESYAGSLKSPSRN